MPARLHYADRSTQAGKSTLTRITFTNKEEVKLRCRDGFKLALSIKEIEECIAKVDRAYRMMESLLQAKTKVISLGTSNQAKRQTKELVQSLTRIRNFANNLYRAIAAHWARGCQSSHEINLRLEDRIATETKSSKVVNKLESSVKFDAVFVSRGPLHQLPIWRASLIEVLCRDNCESQEDTALKDQQSGSRVRFVLPPRESQIQQLQSCRIADMCVEVCKAPNVEDILQLYVHPTCTVHHQTGTLYRQHGTISTTTVTLQELLASSRSQARRLQLSPTACTELTLIVASALLQLSETPWCAEFWTKEGLSFTRRPAIAVQTSQSSDVDITRPLVVKAFQSGTDANSQQQAPSPKKVLLEFAILMLEIWHGISIEERFPDRLNQVQGDDLDRKHLAERWLSADDLLDFQYDAINTCLQYYNVYKINGDITWEDEEFLQEFVAGVLEPLHRQSKTFRARRSTPENLPRH